MPDLNKLGLVQGGDWYRLDGGLTEKEVRFLNKVTRDTIVSVKNTKKLNKTLLREITNPKVQFSVRGGLDYLEKEKNIKKTYVKRTIHTPSRLASIIEKFEKIERKIRYTWTDNQKCMFIYKTLVEELHYKYPNEPDYENGRDVVRSLEGLLYGKSVCAGLSLIFKEALDRIGIECIYQSRQGVHAWNIVKMDGKYRGVELTWECYNKGKDNICEFLFYKGRYKKNGKEIEFYQDKKHCLDTEPEEIKYDLVPFEDKELEDDKDVIIYNKNTKKIIMKKGKNGDFWYLPSQSKINGIDEYLIFENGKTFWIYIDENLKIEKYFSSENFKKAIKNTNGYIGKRKFDKSEFGKRNYYIRNDNSDFYVVPRNKKGKVHESYLFEVEEENGDMVVHRYVILSENDLGNCNSKKNIIANNLLSKERVKRKVENFNGYVGYIEDEEIYYDAKFEKDELNILERG